MKKGFTLTEVLIALALLMIVVGPLMLMYTHSTSLTAQSYRLSVAQATAMLRLEELVGRNDPGNWTLINEPEPGTGMTVDREAAQNYNGFPALVLVTVTVRHNGKVLYELEDVLNVAAGGVG